MLRQRRGSVHASAPSERVRRRGRGTSSQERKEREGVSGGRREREGARGKSKAKGGSEEREGAGKGMKGKGREESCTGAETHDQEQNHWCAGECFRAFGLQLLRAYPSLSSMLNARFVVMQHENKRSNGAAPCIQQDVETTGASGNGKEGTKSVDTPSRKVRRKKFFFDPRDCIPYAYQIHYNWL